MTHASTGSNSNNISRPDLAVLAVAVILIAGVYLLASRLAYGTGFPLDDSWIHQTYARNLALHGEWAFRSGVTSAGSTSPLWSALLALGFLFHLSPYIWTFLLGGLILFGLAVLCEWAVRNLVTTYQSRLPWVGIFIASEWHLAWAAMSGMETLLHGLILTTVLVLLMTKSTRYLSLGLLTGLAVWIRPDGLTLLGPIFLVILFVQRDFPSRGIAITRCLIGFGSLFVPYLLFNLAIGGAPMPNTFYAKQAEYAAWQNLSIVSRLGQMFVQLLVGPNLLLLPGLIGWAVKSIRNRMWGSLAALIWCGGYLWLYVSRLPVYQHGRYVMPAMPILFLFGLLAFADFDAGQLLGRNHWVGRTAWRSGLLLLVVGFIYMGARAYAADVTLIESQMVVTAKWISRSVPADTLIAAHDIGALGYFDSHALIDLAGLISPEVIPFIRDEPELAVYLDRRGANYLVAFPDFYPSMTRGAEILFVADGPPYSTLSPQSMTVYLWKRP